MQANLTTLNITGRMMMLFYQDSASSMTHHNQSLTNRLCGWLKKAGFWNFWKIAQR
jgi:hypothetical protein